MNVSVSTAVWDSWNLRLAPATHAQETCSRNWCKSLLYQKLERVLVNLAQVFFLYKFLARNRTQLCSSTETVWHVTRTVQCDWPESCCCARNCVELFMQVTCTSLW